MVVIVVNILVKSRPPVIPEIGVLSPGNAKMARAGSVMMEEYALLPKGIDVRHYNALITSPKGAIKLEPDILSRITE